MRINNFITGIQYETTDSEDVKKLANIMNDVNKRWLLENFLFAGAIMEGSFHNEDIEIMKTAHKLKYEEYMSILVNNPYYIQLCIIYDLLKATSRSTEIEDAFFKACTSKCPNLIYNEILPRIFITNLDIKESITVVIGECPINCSKIRYPKIIEESNSDYVLFKCTIDFIIEKMKLIIEKGKKLMDIFARRFLEINDKGQIPSLEFKTYCEEIQS